VKCQAGNFSSQEGIKLTVNWRACVHHFESALRASLCETEFPISIRATASESSLLYFLRVVLFPFWARGVEFFLSGGEVLLIIRVHIPLKFVRRREHLP